MAENGGGNGSGNDEKKIQYAVKQRLVAYGVTERGEGEEKKTLWNAVGSAFVNKDGSINVNLESFPVSGKVQLRTPKPKEGAGAEE